MTTNSVRSQENRQNTQLHPGQDPDIDFHYTFEIFLTKGQSTVYIMKDHETVGKIPTMAFWNSAKCSDSYYETQDLDISDPDDIERDEPEILPKQYHQIHVLDMNKPYRPTKTEISAQEKLSLNSKATKYRDGIDEHNIINEAGKSVFEIKEGEAIPGLARDHKVQITKNTEFDFVDLNFGVIDNCENPGKDKVLTAQAKDCPSCPKIDLPSKACAYDKNDGKIKCSDFGDIRTIERSADSVYYMTVTRDKENNYKFYFSDKDGNKTDDLELRLNDVKIKDPYLLRALESDYNIQKLLEKFEGFINKYLQEKENAELENFGNQRTADFNLNILSTTIANNPELHNEVATKLVTDHLYSLSETIANKPEFPNGVAYALLSPNKVALTEEFRHNAMLDPSIDLNDAPKTLIEVIKEKVVSDSGRDINPSEIATQLVTGSNLNMLSNALSSNLAQSQVLQTKVADQLRVNPGNARGPQGNGGPNISQVADLLVNQKAVQLGRAVLSATDRSGKKLSDEVTNTLKLDSSFKEEVRGALGQNDRADGRDVNLSEVVEKLVTEKKAELGRAVLEVQDHRGKGVLASNQDLQKGIADSLIDKSDFFDRVYQHKMIDSGDLTRTPKTLATKVTENLKHDSNFIDNIKGDTGPEGAQGRQGPRGIPGQDGKSPTADEVANQPVLQTAVANNSNFRTNVKDLLKDDRVFRYSVKGEKGSQGADGAKGRDASPTEVANKLITTKASDLGRAVISADESDSQRSFSRYVKDWVKNDLKGDSAFKTSIQGPAGPRGAPGQGANPAEVATELLTGRDKITQLGQAVLDAEKSDASHPISTIVTPWVIDRLEINNKNIQEYGERVQAIEQKMEGEESKILELKSIAENAVAESARNAESSKDAADQSQLHAERSKTAADVSEEHAKRSETAADKAGEHAQSSQTAAAESRKHSTKAEASSSNAAAFAENAKEAACAMNPSLSGCSSRSRREAIWEEPESEYENSELTLSITDSVSVI